MRTVSPEQIRRAIRWPALIDAMRDALVAQARGDIDTPMPMHLGVPGENVEVHIKCASRRGGAHLVIKAAGSYPRRFAAKGSASGGMMLLCSAESGDPVALFLDEGWMTDVRTAAVSAMAARALGRQDAVIGLIGTGMQARLHARLLAEVLPLERIVVWGRSRERADALCTALEGEMPSLAFDVVETVADVGRRARLIATLTSARAPLVRRADIAPGSLLLCVGSDSPGKQELDPAILAAADVLLVDSIAQCARLGELQHAPPEQGRAIAVGDWIASGRARPEGSITVCDLTGLGAEDLAIAELIYAALPPA